MLKTTIAATVVAIWLVDSPKIAQAVAVVHRRLNTWASPLLFAMGCVATGLLLPPQRRGRT